MNTYLLYKKSIQRTQEKTKTPLTTTYKVFLLKFYSASKDISNPNAFLANKQCDFFLRVFSELLNSF